MSTRDYLKMRIEIPKFTRCFLCVPLRIGLMIWGVLQVLVGLGLTIFILVTLSWRYDASYNLICVLAALVWLADISFISLMAYAVYKKKAPMLNLSYSYYVVKFYLLLVLLIIGFIMLMNTDPYHIYPYFYWSRVFDPVTVYLFIDNTAFGVLCWLLQGYLTLLVRSEILKLGGRPRVNLKFKVQCIDTEDSETFTPFQVDNLPTTEPLGVQISPPKYEDLNKNEEKKALQPVESA